VTLSELDELLAASISYTKKIILNNLRLLKYELGRLMLERKENHKITRKNKERKYKYPKIPTKCKKINKKQHLQGIIQGPFRLQLVNMALLEHHDKI